MGSESSDPSPRKRHFDITMSKRTRKQPLNFELVEDSYHIPLKVKDASDEQGKGEVDGGQENINIDHKSLKQLIINGNENLSKVNTATGEESRGGSRNSLGEHFTEEEKQLQHQLVNKQQQNSMQGVKLKGMVNRYVKVLSHLIKVRRIGSRNKRPPLRLTM